MTNPDFIQLESVFFKLTLATNWQILEATKRFKSGKTEWDELDTLNLIQFASVWSKQRSLSWLIIKITICSIEI